MASFVIRVWLPDRPGALGQVASRIGAVRGDVVGIDILERDGGQAVDELVVELPDDQLVDLLVAEVRQVDGVAVEEVRSVADALHDPRLDALEVAAQLVGAGTVDELLSAVVVHARRVVGASWVAVVSLDDSQGPLVTDADAPGRAWLEAFLAGSRAAEGAAGAPGAVEAAEAEDGHGDGRGAGTAEAATAEPPAGVPATSPSDVIWAPLPSSGLALVLGRERMPYRARERRQVAALARVVDTRLRELETLASRTRHPSR